MKQNKAKTIERRKELCDLILQTWDSLQTHLKWTYTQSPDGMPFDVKCVQDYAIMIQKLAKLL